MTADLPFGFGLPILSVKTMERSEPTEIKEQSSSIQEPLHHEWNARYYNPVPATITRKIYRDAKVTALLRLMRWTPLFFGTDDRRPYYPNAYRGSRSYGA